MIYLIHLSIEVVGLFTNKINCVGCLFKMFALLSFRPSMVLIVIRDGFFWKF